MMFMGEILAFPTGNKLTPEELTIVRRLDEGLANARDYYNKEMMLNPAAGKLIQELPNYYPHAWIGNHRIYIKNPETGQLVGSIVGKSAKDVRAQYKTFVEKNPEPSYKKIMVNRDDPLIAGEPKKW